MEEQHAAPLSTVSANAVRIDTGRAIEGDFVHVVSDHSRSPFCDHANSR
jgi:hypothetical protein